MYRWTSPLLAVACAANPPAAPLPIPTGTQHVGVFEATFFASESSPVIVDHRLLMVDADRRHLSAYSLADAALAWRTELPAASGTNFLLHERPHHVIVELDTALVTLAVADGGVVARHDGLACHLEDRRGACAQVCVCRLVQAACEDGRPIGDERIAAKKSWNISSGKDGGWVHGPPSCYGRGPKVVGRAGELSVYLIDGDALALDDAGAERWRVHLGEYGGSDEDSGLTADASGLWVNRHDPYQIAMYSTATGALRWSQPHARDAWVTTTVTDGGVVVTAADRKGRTATLYDAISGARRWRVTLPSGNAIAVPARVEASELLYMGCHGAVLDARNGRLIHHSPGDCTLEPYGDGGLVMRDDRGAVAIDAFGRLHPAPPVAYRLDSQGDRTRVLAAEAVVAELEGRFEILESTDRWLVVRRYADSSLRDPDAVALLRRVR